MSKETMSTFVFKAPSGIEYEVKEMTGKDQRILTEQTNKKFGERLGDLLSNILVRAGSKQVLSQEDINSILAEDRKCILWNARQFSVNEPVFKFRWSYVDSERKNQEIEMQVDTSDMEPVKPYKKQWCELSEVDKEITIVLPRSGKEVVFSLLDGFGEAAGSVIKKEQLSSHTPIAIRNPREFMATGADKKNKTPVKLNLDTLSLVDIEYLRSAILENEGKFHTEMQFEHPEAETKAASERLITVDLLGEISFFFPSGKI